MPVAWARAVTKCFDTYRISTDIYVKTKEKNNKTLIKWKEDAAGDGTSYRKFWHFFFFGYPAAYGVPRSGIRFEPQLQHQESNPSPRAPDTPLIPLRHSGNCWDFFPHISEAWKSPCKKHWHDWGPLWDRPRSGPVSTCLAPYLWWHFGGKSKGTWVSPLTDYRREWSNENNGTR